MKYKELSFLIHYKKIKVEGYNLNQWVTRAINEGIDLKNIKYVNDTELLLTVTAEQYEKILSISNLNYKITLEENGGCKAFIYNFCAERVRILGIIIVIAMLLISNLYIREIEVEGYSRIPEKDIREVLRNEGLYEGAFKKIDCDNIEKVLFNKFQDIVWVRVAYQGRFVKVSIAEGESDTKNIYDDEKRKKPCHIVAKKSGYINKILPYRGDAKVEVNDYVKKGQILITGKIQYESTTYDAEKEKEYFVHAEGVVKGRVPYLIKFKYEKDKDKMTEKEINKYIIEDLEKWLEKNTPKNSQILNKSLKFNTEKNIIEVDVVAEVLQDIGEEKVILIGKN